MRSRRAGSSAPSGSSSSSSSGSAASARPERHALALAARQPGGRPIEQVGHLEHLGHGVDAAGRPGAVLEVLRGRSGAERAGRPAARSRRGAGAAARRCRRRCRAACGRRRGSPRWPGAARPALRAAWSCRRPTARPAPAPAPRPGRARAAQNSPCPTCTSNSSAITRRPRRSAALAVASTPKATKIETSISTLASVSRPASVRLKIATASVCVCPGMPPATTMVAPNSPSARAKPSKAAGQHALPGQRQRDGPEHAQRPGAERGRHRFEAAGRPARSRRGWSTPSAARSSPPWRAPPPSR